MRCERCKTSDLTLVSFGVYTCPVCGRVDADGNLLDQPRGDATGPQTFETGTSSFVAPPPVGAATPMVAAPPPTRDIPMVFLVTMGVLALLDIGAVMASHNVCGFVVRCSFYGAIFTGRPLARAWMMICALLSIAGAVGLVVMFPTITPIVRALLTANVLANAWTLYVLLRPDTVAYFTRAT